MEMKAGWCKLKIEFGSLSVGESIVFTNCVSETLILCREESRSFEINCVSPGNNSPLSLSGMIPRYPFLPLKKLPCKRILGQIAEQLVCYVPLRQLRLLATCEGVTSTHPVLTALLSSRRLSLLFLLWGPSISYFLPLFLLSFLAFDH